MTYKIVWSEKALKGLSKLSRPIALSLKEKISNYLIQLPDGLGKLLTGEHKGSYRYRFGDYRVIYKLDKAYNVITISEIEHRSKVY